MAENDQGGTRSASPVTFRPGVLRIDQIVSGPGLRTNPFANLETLKESIQKLGLLHPIVVREEGLLLLAGRRRLEAFRALGREKIPVRLVANPSRPPEAD